MDDEYQPYGEEWKKEMMKLTKDQLIEMIKIIQSDKCPNYLCGVCTVRADV